MQDYDRLEDMAPEVNEDMRTILEYMIKRNWDNSRIMRALTYATAFMAHHPDADEGLPESVAGAILECRVARKQ